MGEVEAWLSLLLGAGCILMLVAAWRSLVGTTLCAAWYWSMVAVAVVSGTDATLALYGAREGPNAEMLRFAAAALWFCPGMALLGAKRPQNSAWQLVVLTLWGILALPALEALARGRGETFSIDPVRSWFLIGLIALGAANHLPTRFAAAALAFSAAQLAIFWRYAPWATMFDWHAPPWIPLALLLSALLCVRFMSERPAPRAHVPGEYPELRGWSVVWRDFRDIFGVVWSVRVMERLNAQAAMCRWPIRLAWGRFMVGDMRAGQSSPAPGSSDAGGLIANRSARVVTADQLSAMDGSLRTLLRRFVSAEWIDQRLVDRTAQ